MDIDSSILAETVVKNGQWIADSATAIRRAQWASASAMAANEKEQAEYEKIGESSKFVLSSENNTVVLKEVDADASPFETVIEEGMEAPLTGGQNGIVTEPDGTKRPSKVPEELQGAPIPWYAKASNPVDEGVQMMLESLTIDWINETVSDSEKERDRFAEEFVKNSLGGLFQ